jgi:periplasmic protein TonB
MIRQMKRILFLLFVIASFNIYGQDTIFYDTNYYRVNTLNEASYYKIVRRFQNDTNRAIEKEYYKTGEIKAWKQYSNYSKWKQHGKQLEFYLDGKQKSETDFEYGKYNGLRKTWYNNGQLRRKDSFHMDKYISGKCYSTTGVDTVYFEYQVQPSFPGGEEARQKYLSNNIIYPESARENGIHGTVYITFFVESDGRIVDVRVLQGFKELSEEALRVVKHMPDWNPGYQEGKKARVKINMPIKFVIVE